MRTVSPAGAPAGPEPACAPHPVQNLAPSGISLPQFVQNITAPLRPLAFSHSSIHESVLGALRKFRKEIREILRPLTEGEQWPATTESHGPQVSADGSPR